MPKGLVDSIMAAPLGVAILASIEARAIGSFSMVGGQDSAPGGVEAAVNLVSEMSFGEFVEIAVETGCHDVGPWNPSAPATVERAYRRASRRIPIAEEVARRFGESLCQPLIHADQEVWTTSGQRHRYEAPMSTDYESVYGAGQFTWAGWWTVSAPPVVAHRALIDAWEMFDEPVVRWRMEPRPDSRVFEIGCPEDWGYLVTEYPRPAVSDAGSWELPSQHRTVSDLEGLLGFPGQRAARRAMRTHLVPDWRAVAEHYDGVHLSWAGFITTEGCVTDLGGGDVAMLRFWSSERTLWLADVFEERRPIAPLST